TSVEDILGIENKCIKVVVDNYQEYASSIEKAALLGGACILGNQAVAQRATDRGLIGITINSDKEALTQAFFTANHLFAVERLRDAGARQIETIINFVDYGILAINNEGAVTALNSEAERMLNLAGPDGSIRETLITEMRRCMAGGDRKLGAVEKIAADLEVVANYQSIISNGEVIGGVATLQELRHFQAVELKTREELARRGRVAKYSFLDIESQVPAMITVIDDAKRFAGYDATVLILGETGVGKEYFAHAMHLASNRRKGPFIAINCAAIPESIQESELFGYAEGAFTGAKRGGKIGLFEQSHGGTIFLDEIGEMTEPLQTRLLRVLQEREVYRVGADFVIPVDIRVIAATNRDLQAMVQEKKFREDLYYRLDVLTIEIPPLRERKMDIDAFVRTFIRKLNHQYRKSVKNIEADGMDMLLKYDWPGNIRELHNVIERLIALTDGSIITYEEVKRIFKNRFHTQFGDNGEQDLWSVETTAIREALAKTGGNKQKAAEMLGIGRATLWRKIKKMD
ncbi:MAG TPA: sigma 54-interacting transcriptional regulator, partial [Negativicutes bacterium]